MFLPKKGHNNIKQRPFLWKIFKNDNVSIYISSLKTILFYLNLPREIFDEYHVHVSSLHFV